MVLLVGRAIDSLVAVLLVVLAVQSLRLVLSTRHQITAALQLPVSYAYYSAILVGMVLMALYQLILMFGGGARKESDPAESTGRSR